MKDARRRCGSGSTAGYEDTNDAERLAVDPAMRQVVGGRAKHKHAASTSQMSRFETDVLTRATHLAVLMDLSGRWIDAVHQRNSIHEIILDLDSSISETYGEQEGSAYKLGNFLRRLALPRSVQHWTLTTLRDKLIKIGAKVVRHARYVMFQMTEVAVPRELFAAILGRIERLRFRLPLAAVG